MDWKYFGAVLLIFNISESFGIPPVLDPNVPEIAVSENGTLEFKCTAQENVTFIYQLHRSCWPYLTWRKPMVEYVHPFVGDQRHRECISYKPNITYGFDGTNYVASFRRENIQFTEYGWYGCVSIKQLTIDGLDGLEWTRMTPDSYKNSEVAWIYVYVKSLTYNLVELENMDYYFFNGISNLYKNEGEDVLFQCTPTSPEIETTFKSIGDRIIKNVTRGRSGFTMKNVTTDDRGRYGCFWNNGTEQHVEYQLNVEKRTIRREDNKVVIRGPNEPLILGRRLTLTCVTNITRHLDDYALRWKIPNQVGPFKNQVITSERGDRMLGTDHYSFKLRSNKLKLEYFQFTYYTVSRKLTIENVTSEDNGEYECIRVGYNGKKIDTAKINITFVEESVAYIPKLSPNVSEIVLKEGEALEITCDCPESSFIYPTNTSNIHTSSAEISELSYYRSVLKRNKTVYGDTGWYGCISGRYDRPHFLFDGNTPYTNDNPKIKWIYVYVESKTNPLVESSVILKRPNLGFFYRNYFIIPCRPTSPDYKIKLFKDQGQKMKPSDRLLFDPKRGFVLKNLTIEDIGHYRCVKDENSSDNLLYPNVEEIFLLQGDTLELNCTGRKNVTFIYRIPPYCLDNLSMPLKEYEDPCPERKPNISYEFDGNNYFASFSRKNVVFGETGWYGCVEVDQLKDDYLDGLEWLDLTPHSYKRSISWIYVYIQNENQAFSESRDITTSIYAKVGDDVFFPCSPLSPNITSEFRSNDGRIVQKAIYNLRKGFMMKYVMIDDAGHYGCFSQNSSAQHVKYELIVNEPSGPSPLNEYELEIGELRELKTSGETIRLKCIADGYGSIFALRWNIPNKNRRIKTEFNTDDSNFASSELIIDGATSEDEGLYECIYIVEQGIRKNSIKTNLTLVRDTNSQELSLNVGNIYLEEGDPLEITCNRRAPTFIYPKNSTNIQTSSAEIFKKSFSRSVLKRNKTVYGDSGWYGCVSGIKLGIPRLSGDEDLTPYNYNNSHINWTYVYVKSNSNHFIQVLDITEQFNSTVNEDVILPCRPTSPKYKIKLLKDGQKIEPSDRLLFDSKKGFELKNVTIGDSGNYKCVSEENNQELNYYINITAQNIMKSSTVI